MPTDGPGRTLGPAPLVGLLVFTVAAWSTPQGLHWLDTGEFTAAGAWLGVAHPPGQPLHALLTRLGQLVPVGSLATRSSWTSAAALALLWAAAARLVQRLLQAEFALPPRWLLLVGAPVLLGAGLAASSLLQGVRAEVYALHGLLIFGILHLLAPAPPTPRRRLLALLLLGLALANHHFLVLLALPGLGVVGWGTMLRAGGGPPDSPARRWRELVLSPLALAAGGLTYLYLPLRALSTAPFAWGDPWTLDRCWWVVSARVFQKAIRATPSELLTNLGDVLLLGMEPLHPVGFAAALVGGGLLLRRHRRLGLGLGLLLAGTLLSQSLMSIDPANPDLHGYFLVATATIAVLAAYCAAWLVSALRATVPDGAGRRVPFVLLGLLLLLLPVRSLEHAAEPRGFAALGGADLVARTLLERLPPHAVTLTGDFATIFLLWGTEAVEARRPDVTLIHRNFLPFPGWVERETRLHPELGPLLRELRQPRRPEDGPALSSARPLRIEPYHNLEQGIARQLQPDGLLHRLTGAAPAAAAPDAQERFWERLYAGLGPADRADPQTRRYLFWQHVLQGQQARLQGAGERARDEFQRALELAPGNPDVLEFVDALYREQPALGPRPGG
ncbi:MAG: DUF2723 domain-containing protein [Myxococcota bacterium]|jgi:hypothetical protein|nr:DUF2723 domain-containing protein [Myxococcota bacterium]